MDQDEPIIAEEELGQLAAGALTRPVGLTVVIQGDQVILTWEETEEDILGYNVYRSTLWAEEYEHLFSQEGAVYSTTEARFVDTGLTPGEVYFYKIESVGESGKSELSDALEAIVSQEESGAIDADAFLKPDQPYVGQQDAPVLQERFFSGKRLWGIGLLVGSAGFVYQGFVLKDEADKIFARYENTTDPVEADRLFQQTSNKDIKGQVSWAVGAAFAVAGLRLILSRDTPPSDISVASVTLPDAIPFDVRARMLPRSVGFSLSKSF